MCFLPWHSIPKEAQIIFAIYLNKSTYSLNKGICCLRALKIGPLSLYILWGVSFSLRRAAKFQKEGKYGAKLSLICVTTLEKTAHIKTIFCGDTHHFPPHLSVLEDQHIRGNYFAFLAVPCSNVFSFFLFWLWELSY